MPPPEEIAEQAAKALGITQLVPTIYQDVQAALQDMPRWHPRPRTHQADVLSDDSHFTIHTFLLYPQTVRHFS